jgi:hypothetical protein
VSRRLSKESGEHKRAGEGWMQQRVLDEVLRFEPYLENGHQSTECTTAGQENASRGQECDSKSPESSQKTFQKQRSSGMVGNGWMQQECSG